MSVQILGTGCPKGQPLEARVKEVAELRQLSVEIEKVTDIDTIMGYGVMITPCPGGQRATQECGRHSAGTTDSAVAAGGLTSSGANLAPGRGR